MHKLEIQFNSELHKKYLLRQIYRLPYTLSSMDSQRVVLLYFSISGLDLLNELDFCISNEKRLSIIEWIYSLQIADDKVGGFQGSTTFNTHLNKNVNSMYKWGHIATTYSALCTLIILGDDLERVNKDSLIKSIRTLQLPNGCFTGAKDGTESDMRFVYCAACICYILNDWSGMDVNKTFNYIIDSMSYDYGIAQGPGLESHSGSTFCAVATLSLTNQLNRLTYKQIEGLKRWLLNRLDHFGFAGRPNKPEDTCYSFWTGGALKILNSYEFIESYKNNQFILATQYLKGGFSKWINTSPDPLHTYLGLAGLSFMKQDGITDVFPSLNISIRAYKKLLLLHNKWKS